MTGPGFPADRREELRALLRDDGFLHRHDGVPITAPDGTGRAWMFYSWAVSATGPGARLIGAALLDALSGFTGTQLAAYGAAAAPLTAACVLLDDRCTGLTVRPAAKGHGAGRRVEGRPDRSRPVVVVDDSLSSGRSFLSAAAILEREGFEVEGLVALVEFPGRGGRERAEGLGYRVRTVYDVWSDLGAPGPPDDVPDHGIAPRWAGERVPDGLHPARVARLVLERIAATGTVPLPPARFHEPVDGRGGVFVSVRRRHDHDRSARSGFWRFDPGPGDPCRDLVLAAAATAGRLPGPVRPDEDTVAVTFLGPLEETAAAELDYDRYGVVVRSAVWRTKAGGALPNTEYVTSTLEQYRHARWVNGGIDDLEPHRVFRHELVKYVEPGRTWPAYGIPLALTDGWADEPGLGDALLEHARTALGGGAAPSSAAIVDRVPVPVDAVAVALYSARPPHAVVGHASVSGVAVDVAVARAAADAARGVAPAERRAATVCVSVLHGREALGTAGVTHKLRPGRDAVAVADRDRGGLLVEYAGVHHGWSRQDTADALRRLTGVTGRDARWSTYRSASWIGGATGPVRRLDQGFPRRAGRLGPPDVALLAEHLRRRLDADGWPAYGLDPRTAAWRRRGTAARCLHALRVLRDAGHVCDRPAWRDDAARGIRHAVAHLDLDAAALAVPGHEDSPMAWACLLAAVDGADDGAGDAWADRLALRLASWVRPDGAIRPPGVPPTASDPDYLPGAVLVGLARHRRAGREPVAVDLSAVLRFYRRRFRACRSWSLAAWHAQAWSECRAAGMLGPDDGDAAAFVMELADWMVDRQLRADGSYLIDLGARGPSVLTGFAAEGVGAAWRLAETLGDTARAARFGESWRAAMTWLDRLVVRPMDTYWMRDPQVATGGVRGWPSSADLRVDHSSHVLRALLHGVVATASRGADPGAALTADPH